uniref:Uncharacterized protein n=1 Tax=Romanomermis culicivorax TaxID=13658 RepID=A0A915K597_ROMCU
MVFMDEDGGIFHSPDDEVDHKKTVHGKINIGIANACRRYNIPDAVKTRDFYLSSGPVCRSYARQCASHVNSIRSSLAHDEAMGEMGASGETKSGRTVLFVRHGETIDKAFPEWYDMMKVDSVYKPYDLNQPPRLFDRPLCEYADDPPLSEMGSLTSQMVGRGMSRCHLHLKAVIASPSLMCIQTACTMARQIDSFRNRIIVEPGLFHWAGFHRPKWPKFVDFKSTSENGYFWLDNDYKPIISLKDMQNKINETIAQYNYRICYVMSQLMTKYLADNTKGLLVVVGHSSTLDFCARWLMGKSTVVNNAAGMTSLGVHYPFSCVLALDEMIADSHNNTNNSNNKHVWNLSAKRPIPPLTVAGYSNNADESFLKRSDVQAVRAPSNWSIMNTCVFNNLRLLHVVIPAMVSSSNSLYDQERTYSSLCLILITVSTYIFTVIIILTMCCGKETKEENEEQANQGKKASRTVSTKLSALDKESGSTSPKSRKPPQKKIPVNLAKSRRKFPAPSSSSAPKSSSSGGATVNDEGPKVLPVDQIFPYANAPGKEEEHSRLIGISFASTMANSMLETSESKSKEKLGSRSPALLKASSPPVPSFLRKTMIRTTTKEDDEAQNPMLLEMDPATIYKNAPVTKKDSSSQRNKNVSTYNKIVPKRGNKNDDLKSGCKMDVSASAMKDAYTSKKDDLMMVSFSAVPRATDDKEKSKKKVDESQYTPVSVLDITRRTTYGAI